MFIKKADEGFVVEMSAAEHKKAMTYGTEEYRALREIRNDYPGIEAKVVSGKKTVKVKDKLNMNTIKAYVKANGTDEQKAAFESIAFPHITDEGLYIEAQSFFEIKKWFYAAFPEYKKAVDDRTVSGSTRQGSCDEVFSHGTPGTVHADLRRDDGQGPAAAGRPLDARLCLHRTDLRAHSPLRQRTG